MSSTRAVPDGLRDREAERGSPRARPPVPYVPEEVDRPDSTSLKVKIAHDQDIRAPIYAGGSKEDFLVHLALVQSLYEKNGTNDKISGYKKELNQVKKDLKAHIIAEPKEPTAADLEDDDDDEDVALTPEKSGEEAVESPEKAAGAPSLDDAPSPAGTCSKKKSKRSSKKDDAAPEPDEAEASAKTGEAAKTPRKERGGKKKARRAHARYERALAKWQEKGTLLEEKAANFRASLKDVFASQFTLYENLLSEDHAYAWRQITKNVCSTKGWKCSLSGRTGPNKRGKNASSFAECLHLHRLTVFPYDAAEKQRR